MTRGRGRRSRVFGLKFPPIKAEKAPDGRASELGEGSERKSVSSSQLKLGRVLVRGDLLRQWFARGGATITLCQQLQEGDAHAQSPWYRYMYPNVHANNGRCCAVSKSNLEGRIACCEMRGELLCSRCWGKNCRSGSTQMPLIDRYVVGSGLGILSLLRTVGETECPISFSPKIF